MKPVENSAFRSVLLAGGLLQFIFEDRSVYGQTAKPGFLTCRALALGRKPGLLGGTSRKGG